MWLHTPHSDRWSGNLSWPSSALARVQTEATSTFNTLIGHFQTQTKKRHLLMKWRGSHRFCLCTTLISVHYVGVFSPSSSDSQSEILKVSHKKVTEGDIHLIERDYEYSIENFLSICPQPISLWWMLPGREENKIRLVRTAGLCRGHIGRDIVWWPIVTTVTIVTRVIRILRPSTGHSADWGWVGVGTWAQARDSFTVWFGTLHVCF